MESLADVFSDSDDQDDDGKKLLRYHCIMTGKFAVGLKLIESSFEKVYEELESSADEEILRYVIHPLRGWNLATFCHDADMVYQTWVVLPIPCCVTLKRPWDNSMLGNHWPILKVVA